MKKWCHGIRKLTRIEVSPNNKRYSVYDEKFIFEKSKIEDDNYNVLVIYVSNVRRIQIPSFIEIIDPYALENCSKLIEVDIPSDSKLQNIESHAFCNTMLKKILFPQSLTQIGESAFLNTLICSAYIPPKITELDFSGTNLKIIEFDENFNPKKFNRKIFEDFNQLIIMVHRKTIENFSIFFE